VLGFTLALAMLTAFCLDSFPLCNRRVRIEQHAEREEQSQRHWLAAQ